MRNWSKIGTVKFSDNYPLTNAGVVSEGFLKNSLDLYEENGKWWLIGVIANGLVVVVLEFLQWLEIRLCIKIILILFKLRLEIP